MGGARLCEVVVGEGSPTGQFMVVYVSCLETIQSPVVIQLIFIASQAPHYRF